MNIQTLVGLFDSTYHQDPSVRKNAEQQLTQLEPNDGFLNVLLQAISSSDLPLGTKQAASIYFKNRIRRAWSASPRALEMYAPISESDRSVAKENILNVIHAAPQNIKAQLTECLSVMLNHDFPEKWPQFTQQLQTLLRAQEPQLAYTGLLALLEVIKVYRYSHSKRKVLDEISAELFPRVQVIADEAIGSDDELAMRMVWAAFKSYYATIQVELPVALQQADSLVAWGNSFIKMIEKPAGVASDDSAQEPVWKAKKWAVRSVNRLYNRYGNPALLPMNNKKYSAFARLFTANFLPRILGVYLQLVDSYAAGQGGMTPRICGLVSQLLSDCVKEKAAWKLLKPHVEHIVAKFIFPQMCFSEHDRELWEDNAVEYVQKKIDPIDDFGSPALAASNLLIDLAVDRRKATLTPILAFINSVLAAPNAVHSPQLKDGALNMMSSLCGPLCSRKSPIADKLPSFLQTHVIPEFKSKNGFLRARALDTYCRYSSVEFDNQTQQHIFEAVYALLSDPELPVRVHAALALQPMIENEHIRSLLVPYLPQIMEVFLALTNEIDSDTITHVIEEFVEVFADQMAPFATQLAQQLCDTFMRVIGDIALNTPDAATVDIDEISDKTMAAMGVLKTLGTLVLNLESSRDVVLALEEVIFPVIRFVLGQRLVDLYDEVFEILDCCTFSIKYISPNAWNLFGTVYECVKDDGIDFIEVVLPTLDNYVTYGMDVVATTPEIQSRLYDVVETVMKSDRVGENDRVCACKLAESIMLNGKGKVDGMIPGFISLAAAYLLSENAIQTRGFLVYALEVVLNALNYNARITVSVLEQYQWTTPIFTLLMQNIDKFARVHDKKLLIFGLTHLLALPSDQLPASLRAALPQMFDGVLHTFHALPQALAARDDLEKMYEGAGDGAFDEEFEWDGQDDDDDDEFGEDFEGDTGGEDADEIEQEYMRQLASQASKALGDEADSAADAYASDDDDYDDALEEEIAFESVLDSTDTYIWFQDKMTEIQGTNTASYNIIVQSLNPEKSQFLQTIIEEANKQRTQQKQQQQQ